MSCFSWCMNFCEHKHSQPRKKVFHQCSLRVNSKILEAYSPGGLLDLSSLPALLNASDISLPADAWEDILKHMRHMDRLKVSDLIVTYRYDFYFFAVVSICAYGFFNIYLSPVSAFCLPALSCLPLCFIFLLSWILIFLPHPSISFSSLSLFHSVCFYPPPHRLLLPPASSLFSVRKRYK